MKPRVVFVHGLEGNPQGSKARFLAEHFDALTPAMDTSSFEGSIETIRGALASHRPDVLVGSSFGGAVALALLQRGEFDGPALLLAPAARAYGLPLAIPAGARAIIAHGTRDDVVPPDDSRTLAESGSAGQVELVMVDDEHRLQTLVDSARLAELVTRLARPA